MTADVTLSSMFDNNILFLSWQSSEQGITVHEGKARRGVSVHHPDAHTDTQTGRNKYSYPGGFAAPPGCCTVSQQSPGVSLWKVSTTPNGITRN